MHLALRMSLVFALTVSAAQAQNRNLKAEAVATPEPSRSVIAASPPPTIADLVLLLQSYKPDPERIARLRRELDAAVAETGEPGDLAAIWHTKALVAGELQELERRGEFLAKALDSARLAGTPNAGGLGSYQRLRSEYADNLAVTRSVTAALDSFAELLVENEKRPPNGFLIHAHCQMTSFYLHLGDIGRARASLAKAEAMYKQLAPRPSVAKLLPGWAKQIEIARGFLLRREGRIDDEERAFAAAVRQAETEVALLSERQAPGKWVPPSSRVEASADGARIWLAQTLVAQERLDEAELMLREVLKRSLARDGRNSALVGRSLAALRSVYINRGRYVEAMVVAEWADRTMAEAGLSERSTMRLNVRIGLVNSLSTVGRHREAVALADAIRAELTDDSRLEEGFARGTLNSIRSFIVVGRVADALRDGDHLLARHTRNFGADHYYTAEARAYRAMAVQRAGRVDEARREFERAVTVLIDPGKVLGKQKASLARTSRLRLILNEYLAVLAGSKGTGAERDRAEAFRVADVARWQSVQKAVTGSALRAAAGSPELGSLIKKVQDADDELEAVYKNLISQRSAPPDKQLSAVIAAMETRIAALQKEQQSDLVEIRRQFPQYDALVSPRPADLETARKALLPNEALLSIYVTPGGSYVWALGTEGALHFHFSPKNPAWVAGMVKRLRASVELGDKDLEQMRFDLEAGSALYQELLAPVRAAWEKADTLLVIANESLGQIPFSLLPTEAAVAGKAQAGLPLSQFRQTPWLARKLAVAYVPSISALVTLRALPEVKGQRDPFIGFGDPDFGTNEKKSVEKPADKLTAGPGGTRGAGKGSRAGPRLRSTRNLKISHAPVWDENIAGTDAVPAAPAVQGGPLLTPLPDTRDEILAIGTALAANMRRDTFFGERANRKNVIAADLKHRRVVAFATHGLVAGDLPGLDQPALALALQAGKGIEDGLLKLEDILKLSLNADLVVLSACNTAAADGSGAEAVSGLGRGFFYAGARAVLATHWPVETVSARELVTLLFQRYAKDGTMTRAKALQQAMLEMIDKGVALDERGKADFSYAHPAFWAPYALYGDPGR